MHLLQVVRVDGTPAVAVLGPVVGLMEPIRARHLSVGTCLGSGSFGICYFRGNYQRGGAAGSCLGSDTCFVGIDFGLVLGLVLDYALDLGPDLDSGESSSDYATDLAGMLVDVAAAGCY